jgi:serine/threonine-protein kinase
MSLLQTDLGGRITLKGVLGIGGMGEVYRAWDAALERPVAVKFVRSGDPKEADRLLLEARLQARVEHPNVVHVLDTGTLEGRSCILLQLVEGQTFADLDTGADWRVKVALAIQAARGLGAAHRQGLIHRDVKPANILVEPTSEGPRALLSDFGLARGEEGGLTRSGLMMGTVDYMAPEQVTGTVPVDFRADIYGLGATLYAVLAGRPPFRHKPGTTAAAPSTNGLHGATNEGEANPGDLLRRVLEEDPNSLAAEVPGLPKDLAIVVAKAMEKEPAQRYATAEALAEDLERVLRGEAVAAKRSSLFDRLLKWSRRNRVSARLAAGAGLIFLLGLGYTVVASRRAGLEALENAQMGAEAATLENVLRREYLLPAHDLRPAMGFIRQRISDLSGRRARAEAPRAYALGRGYQLLGDWSEAKAHMELARARGFHTPEGELGYGLVLAELYEVELAQTQTIPDPDIRKARLEAVRQNFLLPALTAIRSQVSSNPDRTHTLLGRVAFLEGRLEEAQAEAAKAQAIPIEQADGLLLQAKVLMVRREDAYVHHAHPEAIALLRSAISVLERAQTIARSDPRVAQMLTQCSLLVASHQRSLGLSTAEALGQAKAHLEAAKLLHGDAPQVAILEATLLQRLGLGKKDIGQSGVSEDAAALQLLKDAAAREPNHAELQRFLVNAYYSYAYAKVAVGQDPGTAFEAGYQAIEAARQRAPQDWRLPYTGALLAQPHSVFLNNHGLDARLVAQRGIDFADRALALGAGANAMGIHADCLVELAKAQYGFGDDPTATLTRIMEDNGKGVALAPTDQIMRINAASAAVQAALLAQQLGRDPRPYLAKGHAWNEGAQPKYIEAQRNRLDLKRLSLEAGPVEAQLQGVPSLLADCLAAEKQFRTPLSFQSGCAYRLTAMARAQAGLDPSAQFAEAAKRFLRMEKENGNAIQAPIESALTRLQEARWRRSRGLPVQAALQEAGAALTRARAAQPEDAMGLALKASLICVEAESAPAEKRTAVLGPALMAWQEALRRNQNLKAHPVFQPTVATLERQAK